MIRRDGPAAPSKIGSVDLGAPIPGFYKRRLVRAGAWVPVSIGFIDGERDESGALTSDQQFPCLVNGVEADAFVQWPYVADHPISAQEYAQMMGRVLDVPVDKPVDLTALSAIW